MDFIGPVKMGDWVSFFTRTEKVGTTSVVVRVLVVAHRGSRRTRLFEVTEAELVFVAVDAHGQPAPIIRAS